MSRKRFFPTDVRERTFLHPSKPHPVYNPDGTLLRNECLPVYFGKPCDEAFDIDEPVDLSDPVSYANACSLAEKHNVQTPVDIDPMEAIDIAKSFKDNI